MVTIDIKDIILYCECPMKYFFHKENIKTEFICINEKFEEDMKASIFNFNKLITLDEAPTLGNLNQIFINRWIGTHKDLGDIIFIEPSSWRDTKDQKRKKGLKSLEKLYKYLTSKYYIPALINYKYTLEISKNIQLTGIIDLVRILNNGEIELLDFKIDDKLHNKVYIEKDIQITASSLAYKTIFKKEPKLIFYGLDKNKIKFTTRSEDDYRMFRDIIINVFKCIYNKIFYASPGDKCNQCIYKQVCLSNLNSISIKGGKDVRIKN